MCVGLGTGSTASFFIRELGEQVRQGLQVTGISTSEASTKLAIECGILLTTLSHHPTIDVTVDGADEVSPQLELIKGHGGALVREKVVAHASNNVVIIVDEGKLVPRLGARFPIPVEVVPFAVDSVMHRLRGWAGTPHIREKHGQRFITDNGNIIVDWNYGEIAQPALLEQQI